MSEWTQRRVVPGQGKNFPQALVDGAGGQWVVSQEGVDTNVRLVCYRNGQLVVDRVIPLPPNQRASGYALSDDGMVWCYTHGAPEGNMELSTRIAEWVPRAAGGGGTPPPTPGPPGL